MDGVTSFDGSLVKIDGKKDAKISAFILSLKYVRSHIPDLVLVLD